MFHVRLDLAIFIELLIRTYKFTFAPPKHVPVQSVKLRTFSLLWHIPQVKTESLMYLSHFPAQSILYVRLLPVLPPTQLPHRSVKKAGKKPTHLNCAFGYQYGILPWKTFLIATLCSDTKEAPFCSTANGLLSGRGGGLMISGLDPGESGPGS